MHVHVCLFITPRAVIRSRHRQTHVHLNICMHNNCITKKMKHRNRLTAVFGCNNEVCAIDSMAVCSFRYAHMNTQMNNQLEFTWNHMEPSDRSSIIELIAKWLHHYAFLSLCIVVAHHQADCRSHRNGKLHIV